MAGCVARSPVAPVKFDLAIIRFSVSQNLGYLKIIQVSGHSSHFWGINSFPQPPNHFFSLGFHENWDNPQFSPMVTNIIYPSYTTFTMGNPHGLFRWPTGNATESSPGAPGSVQTAIGFIAVGVILLAVVALGEHHLRG